MDTLRAENLSCYGYERPTSPTIDALGARGVVFENHFSQGLWTMISVPSIMTGRYFPVNVVENFDYRVINRHPPLNQRTAPAIFKANGYQTAMFTAHRLLVSEWSRLGQDFDEAFPVLNPSGTKPHGTASDVNDEFFKWHLTANDQPFFAYLHLMDNHFPHMPTGKYAQWLDDDYSRDVFGPAGPIDTNQQFTAADKRRMAGLYDGDILYADDQLDRLLKHLDRKGILDNTIVVITSDHGDLLGEDGTSWGHDGFSHDQIMRVPWIMAGPGIPEGVRMNGLTENVDVLPTLIELLGLQTDATLDGMSMMSSLTADPVVSPRKHIFTRKPSKRHYDYPTAFLLRTDSFKYELDSDTGEEHLWKVPDNAGSRVDVLDANRVAAAELKAILEEDFKPRFEAYMDTEIHWILGRIGGGQSQNWHPAEAVRVMERHEKADDLGTDNLWVSSPTLAGPNFLTSCGWLEDAPPVTLQYPIPDGRYHVSVELGRHTLLNDRASALMIKAEDDTKYAPVRFDAGSEPWSYVYGGTWTVQDGSFDIELDEGGREEWGTIRRLRMHPAENATYSFPLAALFEQWRGGTPLILEPSDAYVIRNVDAQTNSSASASQWTVERDQESTQVGLIPPLDPGAANPITLSAHIPDGLYSVEFEFGAANRSGGGFVFTIGDHETFVKITIPEDMKEVPLFWEVTDLQVSNQTFSLTIDAPKENEMLDLVGFHLYPVNPSRRPADWPMPGGALDPNMLTHRGVHPPDPEASDAAVAVDREDLEAIGYVH